MIIINLNSQYKFIKKRKLNQEDELDTYFRTPEENTDCDPIEWWQKNKTVFPSLYKIAFDILCIPAISVPSEQIFSKAGDLITKKRSGLSSKNICSSMCLNSWLKFN